MGKVIHLGEPKAGGGSGTGWDGEVDFFNDLPDFSVNINKKYLVLNSQGSNWALNLKRSGIYIAEPSGWRKISNAQFLFNDNEFAVKNSTDQSKQIRFDASQLTQERTFTYPDNQGTVALVSDIPVVPAGYKRETIITTYSTVDQFPTSQDVIYPTNFGNLSDLITTKATLFTSGELLINESDQYYMRIFGHFGRTGGAGTSKCLFFGQMNLGAGWFDIGTSKLFMVSNANDFDPFEFEVFFNVPSGVRMRYCIVRDSTGNNSGGVYSPSVNFNAPDLPSIGVDISVLAEI